MKQPRLHILYYYIRSLSKEEGEYNRGNRDEFRNDSVTSARTDGPEALVSVKRSPNRGLPPFPCAIYP